VAIGDQVFKGFNWIHEWMRHGEGDDVENAMALLYGRFETENYFLLKKRSSRIYCML